MMTKLGIRRSEDELLSICQVRTSGAFRTTRASRNCSASIAQWSKAIPSLHSLQTGATHKGGVQQVRRGQWKELHDRGFPSLSIRASYHMPLSFLRDGKFIIRKPSPQDIC